MLDDLLRETPLYQYILQQGLQEGREKGLAEGRQEGRQEGLEQGREQGLEQGMQTGLAKGIEKGYEKERQERLASLQQKLLTLVHVRYPGLESLARVQVVEHDDPGALEEVLLKVALAQDMQEAKQHLLASDQQDV